MAMTERLWEVNHPYYCSASNYYVGGVPKPHVFPGGLIPRDEDDFVPWDHVKFASWADFGWKDCDEDYNLLFRWDWEVPDPDDYEDGDELPRERLVLFWMLQRKGRFMITSFPVDRDEEPEIREWLRARFEHLLKLWEPFTSPSGDSDV